MTNQTIFHRIGGFPAVSRLVLDFYEQVLSAEELAAYFAEVDMRRLIEHQAKFISSVMGGPISYSDNDLREIHSHLEVDKAAFDLMMSMLARTMVEHRIPAADVDLVMEQVDRRRAYVVTSR
jgi:hemoglobin